MYRKDLSAKEVILEAGQKVKRWRINKRLTQVELAEKAGLNMMTIAKLEAGRNVSIETFIAVLQALGKHQIIHELFLTPEPLSPAILFKAEKKQQQLNKLRVRKSKPKVTE